MIASLPISNGSGRPPAAFPPALAAASAGGDSPRVKLVEVALDLWNNVNAMQKMGLSWRALGLVVSLAVSEFRRRLAVAANPRRQVGAGDCWTNVPEFVCSKVWCLMSYPINVHRADTALVRGRRGFYRKLQKRFQFTPVPVPIDYRGFHLTAKGRAASASDAERSWRPEEVGGDVALASVLIERAKDVDRPDGLLCLSGDFHLGPAIGKLRFLLYPSRLLPEHIEVIKKDDAGVIWLGKSEKV